MRRVTEAQLGTVRLENVEGAQLVKPGDITGVSVELPERPAQLVSPGERSPRTGAELLLIEVDDPADPSTMARVRAALGLDEAPAS